MQLHTLMEINIHYRNVFLNSTEVFESKYFAKIKSERRNNLFFNSLEYKFITFSRFRKLLRIYIQCLLSKSKFISSIYPQCYRNVDFFKTGVSHGCLLKVFCFNLRSHIIIYRKKTI